MKKFIALLIICMAPTIYADNKSSVFFTIPSASMEPTIPQGSLIVVEPYEDNAIPQKNDIVCIKQPQSTNLLIKRIVGTENDKIQIRNWILYVNNIQQKQRIQEKNDEEIDELAKKQLKNTNEFTIPVKQYYLLGDNIYASIDSRIFGAFTRDEIKGKVVVWDDLSPNDERRKKFLEIAFRETKSKLPIKIDSELSLTEITISNNLVISNFEISDEFYPLPTKDMQDAFENFIIKFNCSQNGFTKTTGVTFISKFTTKNKVLFEIKSSNNACKQPT